MPLPYRRLLKTQAVLLTACLLSFPVLAKDSGTFQGASVGQLESTVTAKGDTLIEVAAAHEIGYAQLLAANPGVDPWLPGTGKELLIPDWHILPDTEHKGLVINVGELRVYYYPPNGAAPMTFPIGIGREGLNTPHGTTTVTRKQKGPVWRPTPRMRQEDPELPAEVHTGPENPLGAYALYMGWPSYLIHGTNKPKAVGRRASSGCIRMYADNIEWLYNNVPVGTKVTSVNQPIKMAWIKGELYLEAEPNDIQVDELEYQNRQITIDIPDGVIGDIRRKAGKEANRVNWEKVRQTLIQRTGVPTLVTQPVDGKEPKITIKHVGHKTAKHDPNIELHMPTSNVREEQDADVVTETVTTTTTVKTVPKNAETTPAPLRKSRSDWDNLN